MADYRYFIKVHIGFPEHWKTAGLSDRAFRVLIELWCLCARNKTDGVVTKAQLPRKCSPKVLKELTENEWMSEHQRGYEMLQYLDHQMSKAEIDDLGKVRAEAGRRGGLAKANRLASATAKRQQTPSKPVAEIEVEIEIEVPTTKLPSVASRATRLPADWQPSPELIAWVKAECPNVDGRTATENFRDWWHSKAGKDATKLDWAAAYRGWMRRENDRAPTRRPPERAGSAGSGTTKADAAIALAEQFAAAENHQLKLGAS